MADSKIEEPAEGDVRIILRDLTLDDNLRIDTGEADGIDTLEIELQDTGSTSTAPTARVTTVKQSESSPFFVFWIQRKPQEDVPCRLYFSPLDDTLVFQNLSSTSLRIFQDAAASHQVGRQDTLRIVPGVWNIGIDDVALIEFKVLPRSVTLVTPLRPRDDRTGSKRSLASFQQDHEVFEDIHTTRRTRAGSTRVDAVIALSNSAGKSSAPAGVSRITNLIESGGITVSASSGAAEYDLMKKKAIYSKGQTELFVASHSRLGLVAVKQIKIDHTSHPRYEKLLIRAADDWWNEFHNHRHLHHSSIVQLLGGDARLLHLYLEYFEAFDLANFPRWRTSEYYFTGDRGDAIRIQLGLMAGVAWIHGQGIVHRDIKPQNLLYDDGRLVICDFGHSSRSDSQHSRGGGTPYYFGPEYLRGRNDKASDVWACGVVLLYVNKYYHLPDANYIYDRQGLYWQVADIVSDDRHVRLQAVEKMSAWLNIVEDLTSKVKDEDEMIRRMLEFDADVRPSAEELDALCSQASAAESGREGAIQHQPHDVIPPPPTPSTGSTVTQASEELRELCRKYGVPQEEAPEASV